MKDKVVVVTGASSGFGAALAELLSSKRAFVVLVARREDRLHQIVTRCGLRGIGIVADMTKRADARRVVEAWGWSARPKTPFATAYLWPRVEPTGSLGC